jgi:hypothetical protein
VASKARSKAWTIADRFDGTVLEQPVLSVSPVATNSDIDALTAKLDKVLAAVAR